MSLHHIRDILILVVACLTGSYLAACLMCFSFVVEIHTERRERCGRGQEDFLHNYQWVCTSYFDFHLRLEQSLPSFLKKSPGVEVAEPLLSSYQVFFWVS